MKGWNAPNIRREPSAHNSDNAANELRLLGIWFMDICGEYTNIYYFVLIIPLASISFSCTTKQSPRSNWNQTYQR